MKRPADAMLCRRAGRLLPYAAATWGLCCRADYAPRGAAIYRRLSGRDSRAAMMPADARRCWPAMIASSADFACGGKPLAGHYFIYAIDDREPRNTMTAIYRC